MDNSIDDRIEIVNDIIKKISSLDRKFFEHNGVVAYIFREGKSLYMRNEYNGTDMKLSDTRPKGWHHGGNLWGLVSDFYEFIVDGDTNHNNGYSGLYCTHWGYSEEAMIEIQTLAKEKKYLI